MMQLNMAYRDRADEIVSARDAEAAPGQDSPTSPRPPPFSPVAHGRVLRQQGLRAIVFGSPANELKGTGVSVEPCCVRGDAVGLQGAPEWNLPSFFRRGVMDARTLPKSPTWDS